MFEESIGSPTLLIGFVVFILAMLGLDLGVFHRKQHTVKFREALIWSSVWVALALVFNLGIYYWFGAGKGLEFFTGYVIEKALSVDNLFVFVAIFAYFNIAPRWQHRVLFWGIIGALIMRAIFIVVGGAMLSHFQWTMYLFGGILVITGIKLFYQKNKEVEINRNIIVKILKRVFPVADENRGARFFIKKSNKWFITPVFLALVTVEVSDLVFAVDSIPAVYAITSEPFIVFTSNIFAILGLRSLYFLLAGLLNRFQYLKIGLATVLVFVGFKMLISGYIKIPISLSLGIICTLLFGSILASMWVSRNTKNAVIEDSNISNLNRDEKTIQDYVGS